MHDPDDEAEFSAPVALTVTEESYNARKASEALKLIRQGKLPHEFCGVHSMYPSDPGALDRWATEDTAFSDAYTTARLIGADAMVLYCVSIADDRSLKADAKKVMIDTRMKIAALWNPDKYGPKAEKDPGTGAQALLHIPFDQLSEGKRAEVEKYFGFG